MHIILTFHWLNEDCIPDLLLTAQSYVSHVCDTTVERSGAELTEINFPPLNKLGPKKKFGLAGENK